MWILWRPPPGDGWPFRFALDVGAVRVLLRCDGCHQRRSVIVAAADALAMTNAQSWFKK